MELANSIIDTLIVYTEAMAFYWFIAALVLFIDKRVDGSLKVNEECATEDKKLGEQQLSLAPSMDMETGYIEGSETKLLPPAKQQMTHDRSDSDCSTHDSLVIDASRRERLCFQHTITPFNRKNYRSYWSTFTCKQLRDYLQPLGYTRLKRMRKDDLIELAKAS